MPSDEAAAGAATAPWRNPLHVAAQLVEPSWAVAQVPDDVRRPGASEERHALGQRALVRRRIDAAWAVLHQGSHGFQVTRCLPAVACHANSWLPTVTTHGDLSPRRRLAGRTRSAELLILDRPIIQGPFGGGLSSVALTAGGVQRGWLGLVRRPPPRSGPDRGARPELRAATRRPFALNLWVSTHDLAESEMTRERLRRGGPALEPLYDEVGCRPAAVPRSLLRAVRGAGRGGPRRGRRRSASSSVSRDDVRRLAALATGSSPSGPP